MQVRRILRALLTASLLVSGGCTQILVGDKDYVLDTSATQGEGGAGGGAGAGAHGGSMSAGPGAGPDLHCKTGTTACQSGCADLDTDASNCGACGRDCLGTSCHAGMCDVAEVASPLQSPQDLALDSTHVYWTTLGGQIQRVPKAGGPVETLVDGQDSPGQIAVDSGSVYWIDQSSGRIMTAAKDGSDKQPKMLLNATGLQGLAVDTDSLYLSRKIQKGDLSKMSKGGGPPVTLASSQPQPTWLALRADQLFWAGTASAGDDMNGDGIPDGEASDYVRAVGRNGGGPVVTLAMEEGHIVGLVAAGTTAVWADSDSRRIRARGMQDISSFTVSDGQDVRGLAGDATTVFWTTAGGTVKSLVLDGGATRVLAIDVAGAGAIAADESHVYFLRSDASGAVLRVAR
jgi:hypothetical protein